LFVPGPTGALTIGASVPIAGAFGSAQTSPVAAQGPDGAVFVAGAAVSPQIIWVVDGARPAAIAEHVTGPVTALAVDAVNLYVGVGRTVSAFSRTTGSLVRSWTSSAAPGGVSQLVVAGTRIWALYTVPDPNGESQTGVAGSLVELNPASASAVRTVTGITGAFGVAAGAAGVYYVTAAGSQLVEQTDAGQAITKPTNQQVNLELSGPSAIQAIAVENGRVLLEHDAGQGLDAVLDAYDATTLAGPSNETEFSANEQLVAMPSGLYVVGNPDTNVCAVGGQQQCVARFQLGTGPTGTAVGLPADTLASTLTGPYPTIVIAVGNDLRVLRIG
jgi:hypothetical protein